MGGFSLATRRALGAGLAPPLACLALLPDAPNPAAFQTSGDVNAIARAGGLTYIGGEFTPS